MSLHTSESNENDEMTQLIFDFLELNGFEKTLASFIEESKTKALPFPEQNFGSPFTQNDGQRILQCFDRGDLRAFTKLWKAFQEHIRVTNEDMKKLEIYLRVYFAMYPVRHGESLNNQKQAMEELKKYFEDETNDFSENIKMLPFFELPYAEDLFENPTFHDLLEEEWVEKLRYQLETTIFRYFYMIRENTEAHSKYGSVLLKANLMDQKREIEKKNGNAAYYQDRFFQLMGTFRKVRRLLRGTRESYGRLLKVAFELICGLEASIAGNKTILEPVIANCYDIFPELFTSDSKQGIPDKEYFKQLAAGAFFDSILDSDVSLFFIGISDMSPDCLDFKKIRETFIAEDSNNGNCNKLCLLQALRWLLTRSPNSCKDFAMGAFVGADILGLKDEDEFYREKLFSTLLSNKPTYLKECLIRLINCFASMKIGRKYLSDSSFMLNTMSNTLYTFDGQTEKFNCQMVIATFQKLSLRKSMRLGMIEKGVIQWLVNYIKPEVMKIENNELIAGEMSNQNLPLNYNPYLMEYGWALLMNLCLHEEAIKPCAQVGQDMIKCAVKMLRVKPITDVIPYVVSTLYSLVQNPLTFPIAVKLNVANDLIEIVKNGIKDMAGQLGSIIRILKGMEKENDKHRGEIDYDDEELDQDEFETEIEIPETWVKALDANTLVGDDLLARKYLLSKNYEPIIPDFSSLSSTNRIGFKKNELIMRPITPSKMNVKKTIHENASARKKRSTSGNQNNNNNNDFKVDPNESKQPVMIKENKNPSSKHIKEYQHSLNDNSNDTTSNNNNKKHTSPQVLKKSSENNLPALKQNTTLTGNCQAYPNINILTNGSQLPVFTSTEKGLIGQVTDMSKLPDNNGVKKKKIHKKHRETKTELSYGTHTPDATETFGYVGQPPKNDDETQMPSLKGKQKGQSSVKQRSLDPIPKNGEKPASTQFY